jgi:hypothetical protein
MASATACGKKSRGIFENFLGKKRRPKFTKNCLADVPEMGTMRAVVSVV